MRIGDPAAEEKQEEQGRGRLKSYCYLQDAEFCVLCLNKRRIMRIEGHACQREAVRAGCAPERLAYSCIMQYPAYYLVWDVRKYVLEVMHAGELED